MAHLQPEITNPPISTKSQATQTLLVQTQIPTQLMSHEVHQFTQLINHDSVEHVGGDTLVNDSDPEGSGNTVVLSDDDDDDAHGDVESCPSLSNKAGPSLQGQRDADPHIIPPGPRKTGPHVEVHDLAPSKLIDGFVASHIHRDLPHSDATTEEEGDIENIGCLDADAESQHPHFIDNKGVNSGQKTLELVQPDVVYVQDNHALQNTPEAALVADMIEKKSSQSRRPSIASVRAESLHASGLRAASRGASIGSEGKDDGNFDLGASLRLTGGKSNGEIKKPLEPPEAELENLCANKVADSLQSTPKAMLPVEGMMARSPCMSTSKSKSKGVSLGCTSQPHALQHESIDSDAMIELNTNMLEDLSNFGRAIQKPKTGTDHPESVSALPESLGLRLRRLHSRASAISAKKSEQVDGANDPMLGVNVNVQPRLPNSQKARKLDFDIIDTSPMTFTDGLEGGGGNAEPKALRAEHDHVLKKPLNMIDAPAGERQSSLPSGFRTASTNISHLESQEPGEDSQANALNIVDKLVWLDATCTADEVVTSSVPQDGSVKGHAGSKGRQSLAQAAQMKIVHDKLDVFDWEDSQVDEGVSPETKQVPASTKARKRNLEAFESMTDRRKRAAPQQKMIETTVHMEKTGDESGKDKRTTPSVGKSEVLNVEPSNNNQEVKPHTLLTTRLRNRIKAESRPSAKGTKNSGSKTEPMKHVSKEKQIDEPVKDLEPGQPKGSGDKLEHAGLSIPSEPRNRPGKIDESGKRLEFKQQNRKGRKMWQADSLSAKDKKEPVETFEVGPQIQGHLVLADRTSQDDAAAELWIEAFTNAENKPPAGDSVEVIKFRKRGALHEHTRQGLKKCKTTEPATVSHNEEHKNMAEKEEASIKESRVKAWSSIQQASKDIHAAAIPQIKGRRVNTRFSPGENQDIEKKEDKVEEESFLKTKQNSKKPRIADGSMFSKVKGRRFGTCNSQEEYQKPTEEGIAEGGPKTRQGRRQCKTADEAITLPIKGREASTCGSAAKHMEVENATEDDILERGSKTRSRVQDVHSIVVANAVKEGIGPRKAAVKRHITKTTANDVDEPMFSRGAILADLDTKKQYNETRRSKKIESLRSHQHLTAKLPPDAQELEANSCKVESSDLLSPPLAIDESIEALAGGPRKSKRRGASSDVIVPESTKAGKNSGSLLKECDGDKSLPKIKDSGCQQNDVSSTILLRRTRSSVCDGGSQKNDSIDAEKDTEQIQDDPTDKQSLQKRMDSSDAKKALKKQVAKSATKATTKSISQRNKKMHSLEMLNSAYLIDEGRRRKRESGCIRVLFSHSLTEETIKHQKKILAKLGGQLAISASDCTHFVSNGFARSQNMLISMAAGKEVVTTLWLENCGQARYFVDEKTYVPQDVKKEKELGFSMRTSLASARRKPLLKGVNVLASPNTVPEPAVLEAVVESAGGQVVDIKLRSSYLDKGKSGTLLLIIANEKDFDFCVQFLDKGLKVYSEELLLHGIVTQTLDYSRYRLFEDFKQQKGSRRAANITA